jgi:diguanylate cyclase (GGDEF)-like protein
MSDTIISLVTSSEQEQPLPNPPLSQPWKILVVDDDLEVHKVTKFVLQEQKIFGRPLSLLYADSASAAREILRLNPDIAAALLDVVMETDHAGLDLVKYIRNELKNTECRLILRTGQPGYAPELSVMNDYDINDYRTKGELTHIRLVTTISAALRSYEQLHEISEHRRGLEYIINASPDLVQIHAIADLAQGVLIQLAAIMKISPNGIVVTHRGLPLDKEEGATYVVGAAGQHAEFIARPLEALPDERIVGAIQNCVNGRAHVFERDYTVLYLQPAYGQDAAIFIDSGKTIADVDRQLLDVFVSNIAACFRNVKLVERLNYIAYHDVLTGLLNRQGFISELDSARERREVVALLDIGHFTDLNDGLGHDFGDALLIAVSERLKKSFLSSCIIARIGSDVFGLVGPEESLHEKSVLMQFSEPFSVGDYQVPVTVSLGLSRRGTEAVPGITAIKQTNIALNLSKKMTPGQQCYFKPEMEETIRTRVGIISDLRQAFAANRLQVWYQPQISLATGRVSGFEALLRWPDGSGFAYPPSVFIPLAEYSGQILSIGTWVMNQACAQYRRLKESGHDGMRFAVNVSMPQFQQEGFHSLVSDCISRYGIPAEFLELEITESIAMDEPAAVSRKLDRLKDLGIQIAIDDFGTGYSSLGQLNSMPIDYLKIDRAFVIEISRNREGLLAETIVDFCRKLGVQSIAEGVETEEQAEFLQTRGCDIIQGYLYGKPMPPDQLEGWLNAREAR